MSQYLLRKTKHYYELAKFDDSDDSVAVYKMTDRGCTCPAGRRGCKHNGIFKAWKADGEIAGYVYDDSALLIARLNVV
jgi:hypothetical protein